MGKRQTRTSPEKPKSFPLLTSYLFSSFVLFFPLHSSIILTIVLARYAEGKMKRVIYAIIIATVTLASITILHSENLILTSKDVERIIDRAENSIKGKS